MSDRTNSRNTGATQQQVEPFSPVLALFNICFTVFFMVLFNVFPQRIGMIITATDPTSFVPLLNPEFLDTYLPWFNAWWGLALALNFAHLGLRRWTQATRWADFGLTLFALSILLRIANRGPAILNSGAEWVVNGRPLLEVGESVSMALSMSFQIMLWLIIAATCLGAIVKFVHLVRAGVAGIQPRPA